MIVHLVGIAEGGDVLHVQACRGRLRPRRCMLPLYSLSFTVPVTYFWVAVYERAQRLAQRGVPQAVVHQLGKADGHLILVVRGVAVQGDALQICWCAHVEDAFRRGSRTRRGTSCPPDGSPPGRPRPRRCCAPISLQLFDELHRGPASTPLTVTGTPCSKSIVDIFRLVRRVFRGFADQRQIAWAARWPGIFQIAALVARDATGCGPWSRDAPSFTGTSMPRALGVLDLLFAGLDVPDAPRGDDLHVGGQRLDGQLETHLVVALAGSAVADGRRAFLLGDLHQTLGDDRAGEAGAQQVLRPRIPRPSCSVGQMKSVDELLAHDLQCKACSRAGS